MRNDAGVTELAVFTGTRQAGRLEITRLAIGGTSHDGVTRVGVLVGLGRGRQLAQGSRNRRRINTYREVEGASGAELLSTLGRGRLSDSYGVVARGGEHPIRMGMGVRRDGVTGRSTDVVENSLAHAATEGAGHKHRHLARAADLVQVHVDRAGGPVNDGLVHRIDA